MRDAGVGNTDCVGCASVADQEVWKDCSGGVRGRGAAGDAAAGRDLPDGCAGTFVRELNIDARQDATLFVGDDAGEGGCGLLCAGRDVPREDDERAGQRGGNLTMGSATSLAGRSDAAR